MACLPSFTLVLVFLGIVFTKCLCVMINEYGEYEKVTISISPHINTSELKSVIEELEILFQEASSVLYLASKGHFSFKEIVFILPENTNITLTNKKLISKPIDGTPDIIVSEEGLFLDKMYTIQHQGCGQQGLRINIPTKFLLNTTIIDKSKAFVHEWAHYRYGVFDENGFSNDSLYPIFHSTPGRDKEEFSVTGCTNQYPSYQFKDRKGQHCQPPEDDCVPIANQTGNENIISSLMHKPFFPKVNQFCDDDTHDRKAPTKQNALCREQSTWKIISDSSDFTKKRFSRESPAIPNFKYVIETPMQLVFAVDTKNLKGSLEFVRNAFSYFVLFDLPERSKVSILDMKTSKTTPFFTIGNDTRRIFDLFPDEDDKAEICLHCSMIAALDALHQNNPEARGCIILATAVDIAPERIEIVRNALPTEGVQLFILLFGNQLNGPPLLESLTTSTGGQFFLIPEELKRHTFLSPLTILYEVFRSIYQQFSWTFRNKSLIDQNIFYNDSKENSISFDVDEDIELLHVILTGPSFHSEAPVAKDKFVLKHGDIEHRSGQPSFSYKIEIPAYLFTIHKPEVGQWTLSFQRKPRYTKPFEVIIRASNVDYRKMTTAHCWISKETKPVIIYNQLYKGIKPVIQSASFAFLLHHETEEETVIELVDNGRGDPDIIKNDGIYTRYISGISKKGFYTVTVVSKGMKEEINSEGDTVNCCGSVISETLAAEVRNFSRIVTYGSFYFGNEFPETSLSPRRIVDLHVIGTQVFENNITHYILQWTAPGAHLDSGTATHYEMKVFQTRDDALNNFETADVLTINEWHTHGEWLKVEIANTIQTVIIELRDLSTGLYFLVLRAINEIGNAGDVSNVVELYFTKPILPTTIPKASTNEFTLATDSSSPDLVVESKPRIKDAELGLIIGVTCGLLFLFLVVGLILLIYLTNKRKLREEKKKKKNKAFRLHTYREDRTNLMKASTLLRYP